MERERVGRAGSRAAARAAVARVAARTEGGRATAAVARVVAEATGVVMMVEMEVVQEVGGSHTHHCRIYQCRRRAL